MDCLSAIIAAERRQPLDVHFRREVLLTEVWKKGNVLEPSDYLFRQPVLAKLRLSLCVQDRRVLRLRPQDLGFEVADFRRQPADELLLGFVNRGKFGDLFFENLDVFVVLDCYESAKNLNIHNMRYASGLTRIFQMGLFDISQFKNTPKKWC